MNVFQYGAINERIINGVMSNPENGTDYKPFTTFASDLSIAEWCGGVKAIKDTYKNVVKSWISNYKYFTEFVMVLNHKCWQMFSYSNNAPAILKGLNIPYETYAQLYSDLYYQARDAFYEYWGAESDKVTAEESATATEYFFMITD